MEKNHYILDTINEIKDVLQKNSYREKRYGSDLLWLNKRKKMIGKNIIRVAIMGITSSGKSTLVNAILGDKILPVAIKPSSSIIITCSKGSSRHATIYFRDKKPKILMGEDLNDTVIGSYADESKNPNNKLKVTQIDIKTPSFLLGQDIHIIDSPGLDACDLEMHEKLTLEILLPTIDICVFLTTVKANSDEINAEKIRIVNKKNKQIILVQNMIDSVEAKFGKSGIIEEDKAVILAKHRKRAENLLLAATSKKMSRNDFDINKYEIIQISALNAMKGITQKNEELYNSSGLRDLKLAIEKSIKKITPRINAERGKSIRERIDHMIATDKEIIENSDIVYINSLMSIPSSDIDNLVNDFSIAREKISLKIKEIDKNVKETISQINNSQSGNIESYLNIIEKINNKNKSMENEIISIVKECEEKKNKLYKIFNLDARSSYLLPIMNSKHIDVKHKYEEKIKLVKKGGILNRSKRILSGIFDTKWGYEKEEYNEIVVDKVATISMVENICNQNRRKYMSVLWDWSAQYNKCLNILYSEVIRRVDEYEKKKKSKIEIDDINDVIFNLQSVSDKLKKLENTIDNSCYANEIFNLNINDEVSITKDKIHVEGNSDINNLHEKSLHQNTIFEGENQKKKTSYFISNIQYNLYKISNEIIDKNYLLIGNYIKEKSFKKLENNMEQIFWTWDIDSCVTFVARTCGIYLTEAEYEILKKEGFYKTDNIIIIYQLCERRINLYLILKKLIKSSYNMFIILNGIQMGNSEKQILESYILKEFTSNNNAMVSLVVDSSKEFINAGNTKELLFILSKLKSEIIDKFKVINGYILINSKNPIYNLALIEGQERQKFKISDYRDIKEGLFKNQLSRGIEEKETIEEILNYFLNKEQ